MADPIASIVTGVAGPLFGLIDDLFTSDEERAAAKHKLLELDQKGQLAQVAVNMREAESESLFVSGWRPATAWVCMAAMLYHYILLPFSMFIATISGVDPTLLATLPELDMGALMPVLLGMLGLGGMRSYEKAKGANKNR